MTKYYTHLEELFFKRLRLLFKFRRVLVNNKNKLLSKSQIISALRMNRNQLFRQELMEYLNELLDKYTKVLEYKSAKIYFFEKELGEQELLNEIQTLFKKYYKEEMELLKNTSSNKNENDA